MTTPKRDLAPLRKAVGSLNDTLGVVADEPWFHVQSQAVQNALIAGVAQNFECVFELSGKMIRRRLEIDSDSPADIERLNYRDLLRTAAEKGLVGHVAAWFRYRELRHITSHSYDHEKAMEVSRGTLQFAVDAAALLTNLELQNG
jgi:nucleotidyltransferase substrate binding protein (TIGR01987 family)